MMHEKIQANSASLFDKAISPTEYLHVRREQITLLFNVSPFLILSSLLIAGLVAMLQWDAIDHRTILLWLACMSLAVLLRFMVIDRFPKSPLSLKAVRYWQRLYMLTVCCLGVGWGSLAVFFYPPENVESQLFTFLTLIFLIGVVAARPMVLRQAFFVFLACVMLPMILQLALLGTDLAIKLMVGCIVYSIYMIIHANQSYRVHMNNILFQIRYVRHKRMTKLFQKMQKKTDGILEMIAKGHPAQLIYDSIIELYESYYRGVRCSILKLQGNRLLHVSAPSLDKKYCAGINNLKIGENIGSCGRAAYLGQRVLVEDITTDPKWSAFKEFTLPFGMRSCWSEPVLNAKGQVLGTLAMYKDSAGMPNKRELYAMESAAHLVSLVMEREARDVSLRTLSQAIEQAGDAFTICDAAGVIEYVNLACTHMLGYTRDELIGKSSQILKKAKLQKEPYVDLWRKVSRGENWSAAVRDYDKSGREYAAVISVSPVFDAESISHYVIIQQDMTAYESLEEQLRQAQKMEAVGTLVGGIAHDFNNILAGMTANLYLAKQRSEALPDVVKGLENVEQLSARGADLIKRLMTFARKDSVRMQKILLQSVLIDALQLIRTSVPEDVEICQSITKEPMYVCGDNTQLHQMLINVVNNAYDALEGVDNPCISIMLQPFYADSKFVADKLKVKEGNYVHLQISDNGCGIPKEHYENLFEPFFTTKEVGKGTGLGLSMVFGAVNRHGGFIDVESVVGKGSIFHIYLPLIDTEDDTFVPTPTKVTAARGAGEVILLVDDDPFILDIGREVLQDLGYKVLVASNGLEAVNIVRDSADEIALMLTDMVMPKLNGVKAAQKIREMRPDMKVIFATGYDMEATFPGDVPQQGEVVLSKPFEVDKMSQVIREQLDS